MEKGFIGSSKVRKEGCFTGGSNKTGDITFMASNHDSRIKAVPLHDYINSKLQIPNIIAADFSVLFFEVDFCWS
ncbi:hypothetical protein SLEP1_g42054 [Rubroshorea leprosula]|uniref:Transposase n=1 Tax=Rubroshorea leprosula TaxID=152421 RepID=A0AAV5L966_9ROSI|nr:hypothetical protein SLEP1_g42054 [Rubroshorea leprosula]